MKQFCLGNQRCIHFLCISRTSHTNLEQSYSCFAVPSQRIASGTSKFHVSRFFNLHMYVTRFEIYCGKKKRADGSVPPMDNNVSGAAAVYRNLRAVFMSDSDMAKASDQAKRVVVCDREYTSYTLVQTLLQNGFYCVGTCMPSRLGTNTSCFIIFVLLFYRFPARNYMA